jgi:hypothetical protein
MLCRVIRGGDLCLIENQIMQTTDSRGRMKKYPPKLDSDKMVIYN